MKDPSDSESFGVTWVYNYLGNDVGIGKAARIVSEREYGEKSLLSKMTNSNAKRQSNSSG